MELVQYIEDRARNLEEITVDVDRRFGYVSMRCEGYESPYDNSDTFAFLQGHEAEEFINKADKLYNDLQTVTLECVYLFLADEYTIFMSN